MLGPAYAVAKQVFFVTLGPWGWAKWILSSAAACYLSKKYSSLQPLFIRWKDSLKGTLELVIFSPQLICVVSIVSRSLRGLPSGLVWRTLSALDSRCVTEKGTAALAAVFSCLPLRTLLWMQGSFPSSRKLGSTRHSPVNLFLMKKHFFFFFFLAFRWSSPARRLKRGQRPWWIKKQCVD